MFPYTQQIIYLSYVQQDLKYVKLVSRLNMQETHLLVKRVNMYSAICNMHNLMTSWPTPSCACDYLDPPTSADGEQGGSPVDKFSLV